MTAASPMRESIAGEASRLLSSHAMLARLLEQGDRRLTAADSEPWCGVQVIDLSSGSCVDWFRIDGDIMELYDLEIVEGHFCPMAVPPYSNEAASLITIAREGSPTGG